MRQLLLTLTIGSVLLCSCARKREQVDQIRNNSSSTVVLDYIGYSSGSASEPTTVAPGETAVLRIYEERDNSKSVSCPHDPEYLEYFAVYANGDTIPMTQISDANGWEFVIEDQSGLRKDRAVCKCTLE